jgi:hypothetical protein
LFLCICVLQPKLVHLYQTSSLFPSPLPIVALASFRLLYSLLYSEHINHIQVFVFLPLPYPSCVQFPLVCDLCPIILLHLFQVYNLHMRENMQILAFWTWLTSVKMMFSSSIHFLQRKCWVHRSCMCFCVHKYVLCILAIFHTYTH